MVFSANVDTAATCTVSLQNTRTTINNTACWEIWTWDKLKQLINRDIWIVNHRQTATNHFT